MAVTATAADVMTKQVVVAGEDTPFKEIVRLLEEHRVNALPVLDGREVLVGIVSEADLLLKEEFTEQPGRTRRLGKRRKADRTKADGLVARDVMSCPVVTVGPEATIGETARLMHEHNVKQLPVTHSDRTLAGIVSRGDLLKVFLRHDVDIRDEIVSDIVTRTLWLDPAPIGVTVRQGVVTLEGQLEQRSLADWMVELVKKVDGVVGVRSRLTWALDDRRATTRVMSPWGPFRPQSPPGFDRGERKPVSSRSQT
jgi:CBS domain-containing protein